MLVIGRNTVLEILNATPKELTKLVFLKNLKPEKRLKEIISLATDNGIVPLFLHKNDFLNLFSSKNKEEGITQGVIGFMKEFRYSTLKDIVDGIKDVKYPLILILDSITDPHNLGAIVRSSACLGADGIVIPRHNSAEINHTALKASSGAAKHIPIAKETNLTNCILYLKERGYLIIGADSHTDKLLYEIDLKQPVGLLLGSEGAGLRHGISINCDELVRIPMTPKIDSLNVSVSAGVFLYEAFRQKNQ